MSIDALKQATGLATTNGGPKNGIVALLEKMKPEIARALPKHLSPDRMIRIALTQFRLNPQLMTCEPESVIASIMIASQLGLEPGVGGQCYLLPYKNRRSGKTECQLVPGWKGLVDLVNRAKQASCWTGAVYEGDEFNYRLGDSPFCNHTPAEDGAEQTVENLKYVYAIGRVKGSDWPVIEVWAKTKVLKHFAKYNKVGDRHYAHENMEMYGRKIALLQVIKYLPISIEQAAAVELADATITGVGHATKISEAFVDGISLAPAEPPRELPAGDDLAELVDALGLTGEEAVKLQKQFPKPDDLRAHLNKMLDERNAA